MALNREWRGDFLGFTYNGIHSADLNIVRTSSNNRYEQMLLPQPSDITVNIPGDDGMYYLNSTYQPAMFNINFAYDNLQETDIRFLQQWLGDKNVHDLIFDENPYKAYRVKPTSQPRLTFVAFDMRDEQGNIIGRHYKGEGALQFQAYVPYARAIGKTLADFPIADFPERYEWEDASGLLQSLTAPVEYDRFTTGTCNLYNPGDIPSPLYIPEFEVVDETDYQSISHTINGDQVGRMILDMSKLPRTYHYKIDSKLRLILAYEEKNGIWVLSNRVFNGAIAAGDFFEVQPNKPGDVQVLTLSPGLAPKINIIVHNNFHVNYDYLYF